MQNDETFEFPATPTQRALWFVHRIQPENPAYNIPVAFRLRGALNEAALRDAFHALVERHEILRTSFVERDGELFQRVGAQAVIAWRSIPAGHGVDSAAETRPADPSAHHKARAARWVVELFDLEAGPPVRACLERFGADDALLVIVFHHIVIDHLSLGQCMRELGALYDSAARGQAAPLPAPELQFADYSVWLHQSADAADRARRLARWQQRLTGFSGLLDLPTESARSPASGHAGAEWRYSLDPAIAERAKLFARQERVSLYSVLLGALKVLLHRCSGQSDIIVGTPFANRSNQEALERVVGCFINTLPIATRFDHISNFRELLPSVKETMLEAVELQDVPLDAIVDAVKPRRDPGRNPMFQVGFVLQDPPVALHLEGLATEDLLVHSGGAMYDLHFWMWETDAGIDGVVWYDTSLYGAEGVQRLVQTYEHLLAQLVARPDTRFDELSLLPAAHAEQLARWNDTAQDWPDGTSVLTLFRTQVERAPQHTAIRTATGTCSYAELAARATRLARHLTSRGVVRGDLVGLCLERSIDMVVAQLAILEAGAAYVPLDPAYPAERLRYMADDAGLALLVSHSELAAAIAWPRERTLYLDRDAALIAASEATALALAASRADDPAYVIYTSGSTGRPKGVVVPHGALANFLLGMAQSPGLAAADRLVAVTTLSFDIAVLELLLPLTVGAEIVLAGRDVAIDGHALRALLERSEATVMQATPSTWRMLLDAGWRGTPQFKALVGGEGLPHDLAHQLLTRCAQLWNMYGPTETTVWSTCWNVDPAQRAITIGRPIANTQIHVLDERLQPRPIGVPGEIYIGGDGVTLGYLHRAELTAERFVPDPFGAPGQRLYRTGDRGRWRHDGLLEHLGRLDFQVKVRGYRIELGEIEASLARHPALARAVVIVREDQPGDVRLVAYVVAHGAAPGSAELRDFLAATLPDYMLPQHFIAIAEVPLLPNGKIDRHALPAVQAAAGDAHSTRIVVAPETTTETALLALWHKALGTTQLGITDDFFEFGGHSMLAMRLASSIQATLGRRIPLSALLQAPTVRKLAAWMDRETARDSLVPIRAGDGRPPLFLVHDGDGETLLYRTLAHGLQAGHPVYGLQPEAGDGHAMLHTRIPDMAAHHLKKIRSAQPQGPYLIGGLCAGGVIAFEVARQLEAQGERVALLALLDVADVETPLRAGRLTHRRFSSFRDALGAGRGGALPRRLLDGMATATSKLLNLIRYESSKWLRTLKTRRDVESLRRHLDQRTAPPTALRELSVREIYMFARSQYRVDGIVHGNVALFRATRGLGDAADEPVIEIHSDPMLGWARRVAGTIQVVDVPGGHVSMLQEPNVATLALALQEQIDRALSVPVAAPRQPALAGERQLACLPG
ncbi:MAG TPA: amino acid adenylation domain-containing protein [Burkholderiaceae bacterium]|nr:amino acid adenylation domain-containing protein [Burkholderiaceae bacterium]